jgi:hypothetical protein
MPMTVNPFTSITTLPLEFVALLDTFLKDTTINSSELLALNFRDPTYSAENGGYHPVEILDGLLTTVEKRGYRCILPAPTTWRT